ncbi:MAG: PadR family transcriptional regulator [Actinomycetota bacterium]|nr:PadR family transcriptional regulator [Actinomycetota bacterium]
MANVILGLLLLAGPQTIYALNKHFEAGVSLFYRASLGSLRGALTGLLERGEVTFTESVENGRSKKTYAPTDAGRAAFFAWLTGPLTGSDLETQALARTFFLGLLPDDDARRAVLATIVARAETDEAELRAVAQHLDSLEMPPEHTVVFRYQRATLEYGLLTHRAGIEHFTRLRDALR